MATKVEPGERSIAARIGGPHAILGLVSTAHAMTHAYSALMPLIYIVVMKEFNFSYAELGMMVGVTSMVSGLLQLAFGFLSRHVLRKVLLGLGSMMLGVSMIFTGFCTSFVQFWVANLAARAVTAPQHPVGNSIVADQFGKKLRGTALAVNFAGGNAGTVLIPIVATFLIANIGWRWTLAVTALPMVVVGLAMIVMVRERLGRAGAVTESGKTDTKAEVLRILTSRNILVVFLVSMMAAGGRGLGIVMVYVPQYLKNGLLLDDHYVGLMFTVLMIGSVVGPLAAGRMSDVWGRKRVLLIAYLASMVFTIAMIQITGNLWLLGIALVFMGLAVYSESPVLQSFLADVTAGGSRDISFGIYFTFTYAAGSLWATLLGAMIDSRGFEAGFYVMAISYVAAAFVVLWTREPRRG